MSAEELPIGTIVDVTYDFSFSVSVCPLKDGFYSTPRGNERFHRDHVRPSRDTTTATVAIKGEFRGIVCGHYGYDHIVEFPCGSRVSYSKNHLIPVHPLSQLAEVLND